MANDNSVSRMWVALTFSGRMQRKMLYRIISDNTI